MSHVLYIDARKALQRIQGYDYQSLIRSRDLGQMDFQSVADDIKALIDLYNEIPAEQLERLSLHQASELLQKITADFTLFDEIKNYNLKLKDHLLIRNSLVNEISTRIQIRKSELQSIIAYLGTNSYSNAEIKKLIGELESLKSSTKKNVKDATDNVIKVTKNVQSLATGEAAKAERKHFEQTASRYRWSATYSFLMFCIVLVLLIIASYITTYDLEHRPNYNSDREFIYYIVSKVLLFSVVVYMLTMLAKSFVSNKHNEVINRHRANAIEVYATLIGSVRESERVVIIQALVDNILNYQDTGFLKFKTSNMAKDILPKASSNLNTEN